MKTLEEARADLVALRKERDDADDRIKDLDAQIVALDKERQILRNRVDALDPSWRNQGLILDAEAIVRRLELAPADARLPSPVPLHPGTCHLNPAAYCMRRATDATLFVSLRGDPKEEKVIRSRGSWERGSWSYTKSRKVWDAYVAGGGK